MIKTESLSGGPAGKKSSPLAACWETDPDPRAVRFELADGEMAVYPYIHLVSIRFKQAEEAETVFIRFTSDEVKIKGHHLHKLLLALQRQTVDWIRSHPARHRTEEAGSGWVLLIEIHEAELLEEIEPTVPSSDSFEDQGDRVV